MSLIMQRRTIPALLFGLALLAGLYTLLVPLAAQAADGPPRAAAAPSDAGPTPTPEPGRPVISASPMVVQVGSPATLSLIYGLPLQSGYFVSQTPNIEYLCDGEWRLACRKPLEIGGDGKASIQVRAQHNARDFDALFNFRTNEGLTLPAGVIVRFYTGNFPPDPPPSAQPQLVWQEISSRYPAGGFYLETAGGQNHLSMAIDFKGQTGYSEWKVNDVTVMTATHTQNIPWLNIDMGRLSPTGVNDVVNGQYTFQIQAFNPSGASKPMAITFIQVPYKSAWFKDISWLKPPVLNGKGDDANYSLALRIPTNGFHFSAPGFITSAPTAKTEAGMTYQGEFTFPVKCRDGKKITVQLTSDSFFTNVYMVEAKGKATMSGELGLELLNCQLLNAKLTGSFYANGSAAGSKQVKVIELLVDWLLDRSWVSGFIMWLLETGLDPSMAVGATVDLHPGLQANASLTPMPANISANATFAGTMALFGHLNLNCCANLGDLDFNLTSREGKVRFDAKGLDNVEKLLFDANLNYAMTTKKRIGPIAWKKVVEGECHYPPNGPQQSCRKTGGEDSAEAWGWIPHPAPVGYSSFQPTASFTGGPTSQVIVSDIFTYTATSLAVDPATGYALALWDHDDLAKLPGQAMEIAASYWNGATWTVPETIMSDDYLDMAAQVAWTTGGHAVAVWHRVNQLQGAGAPSIQAMTSQVEIATATYDENAHTWSPVSLLTSDQNADIGVDLARSPNGKLLAAWASTPGGWSPDGTAAPTPIYAAFYDGGWGVPMLALNPAEPLGNVTAAYGAATAAIAATMPVTPAGVSTPVTQAIVTIWNGTTWSSPQVVPADGSAVYALNLVYNGADQPILVWIGGQILHLRNLITGQVAEMALDPGLGFVDALRVAADAQDNLAVVLRGQAEHTDLYVAYYDHDRQLWGTPRPLTVDAASERAPSLAFDNAGGLHLLYAAAAENDGPTDLVIARYAFARNLTVTVGDLVIAEAHPATGAAVTISGTVSNSGDLPIDGVTLTLYDGDPQGGGTIIATRALTTPLAAGATAVLVTPYTPPVDGGIRTIFLVADGANIVAESDENDNRASLRAFGPDLALTSAEAQFAIGDYVFLAAAIENVGTSSTPTTTLNFHEGTAGGNVTAEITIPPLAAGEVYTDSIVWQQGQLLAGDYPLVASVNEGDFEELDLADNRADLAFHSGPDIMISPYAVETGNMLAASVPITVQVANLGNQAADNVVIDFHFGWAFGAANAVISRTLPEVPANASVELVVNVPGPIACGVNIVAGTLGGADLDWGNNLVVVDGASSCTTRAYLPVIGR